ncbi:MAG TPA: JAB domain-containing protein [Chitinophagaceae bacterium]|nr:JAB domain-containing protein [Chitinophagaceae bacterium]
MNQKKASPAVAGAETARKALPWQRVSEIELIYRSRVKASDRPSVESAREAAELLTSLWDEDKIDFVEQFKVLLLNRANKVLGIVEISQGGVSGTIADPKLIFTAALKANASCLILTHNHPSGNVKPSRSDEEMTRRIKEACTLMDFSLLDHIIISREGYYSFADEGML